MWYLGQIGHGKRVALAVMGTGGDKVHGDWGRLTLRQPGLLILPVALGGAGALGSAAFWAVLHWAQMAVPAWIPIGAGALVAGVLILSLMITPARQWSAFTLFASANAVMLGVVLLGFFLLVHIPGMPARFADVAASVPWMPTLPDPNSLLATMGPFYLIAFTLFSAITPVSLIIFRYIALKK